MVHMMCDGNKMKLEHAKGTTGHHLFGRENGDTHGDEGSNV